MAHPHVGRPVEQQVDWERIVGLRVFAGCGQLVPDEAPRRGFDLGAGKRTRSAIGGRADLGRGVRRGELNPGLAFVDKAEHLSEQRVAGALWFGNRGDMVEHDPRRQILKQRDHGGKIAGPDIDLDMPAERFYAPRQGRDHRSGDQLGARS